MNEEKIDIGLAEAFRDVFISPNVPDRNMEDANVVDALDKTPKHTLLDHYQTQANHLLRTREFKL